MVQGPLGPCTALISTPPPPGEPHGGRETGGEAVGQEIPPPHALSVGHHDADQDDEEEDEAC